MILKNIYNLSRYLSFYLIPGLILIYIYIPQSRTTLFLHGFDVCIVGIIDIILHTKYLSIIGKIGTSILHILIIIPMILYPVFTSNIGSILVLFLGITMIWFLPWWPYTMQKKTMIALYILIYGMGLIITFSINRVSVDL